MTSSNLHFGRIPLSVENGLEPGKLETEKSVRRLLHRSKQKSIRIGGENRNMGIDASVPLEAQLRGLGN